LRGIRLAEARTRVATARRPWGLRGLGWWCTSTTPPPATVEGAVLFEADLGGWLVTVVNVRSSARSRKKSTKSSSSGIRSAG